MNNRLLIEGINHIDPHLIDDYFRMKKAFSVKKAHRKSLLLVKWGATAACIAVLATASVWFFAPMDDSSQAAAFYNLQNDDVYMQYQEVTGLSRFDRINLKNKIGELYSEQNGDKLYKLKGSNSIEYLILSKSTGEYHLLRFRQFFDDSKEYQITLQEVLQAVYGIHLDDIKQISFEKADLRKKEVIEKKVVVNKVEVTDAESLERIYSILCSLSFSETNRAPSINPYDANYLKGQMPLSAQTERKIVVTTKTGDKAEFVLCPFGNCVTMSGTVIYGNMSVEDLNWLIERVEIDMEYHNYGIPEDAKGEIAIPEAK